MLKTQPPLPDADMKISLRAGWKVGKFTVQTLACVKTLLLEPVCVRLVESKEVEFLFLSIPHHKHKIAGDHLASGSHTVPPLRWEGKVYMVLKIIPRKISPRQEGIQAFEIRRTVNLCVNPFTNKSFCHVQKYSFTISA